MDSSQIEMLKEQGYTVIDEVDFFILKRNIIDNKIKIFIFIPFSLICFLLGFGSLNIMDLVSVMALIAVGIILFTVPFWTFLTSPFYSIYIDKSLKTILFRAVHSRAYRFSEVTKMSLGVSSKYTDTNAFSDSNKEYSYTLEVNFGHSKEELFRITKKNTNSEKEILALNTYFEKLLE